MPLDLSLTGTATRATLSLIFRTAQDEDEYSAPTLHVQVEANSGFDLERMIEAHQVGLVASAENILPDLPTGTFYRIARYLSSDGIVRSLPPVEGP